MNDLNNKINIPPQKNIYIQMSTQYSEFVHFNPIYSELLFYIFLQFVVLRMTFQLAKYLWLTSIWNMLMDIFVHCSYTLHYNWHHISLTKLNTIVLFLRLKKSKVKRQLLFKYVFSNTRKIDKHKKMMLWGNTYALYIVALHVVNTTIS